MTTRVRWQLPEVTVQQRPIQYTRIDFRESGTEEWDLLDNITPDVEEQTIQRAIVPGTYDFRATVFDVADVPGPEVAVAYGVDFSAPGAVINLTVDTV